MLGRWTRWLLDILIGKPLASDEEERHKVGPLVGIPMLGLEQPFSGYARRDLGIPRSRRCENPGAVRLADAW